MSTAETIIEKFGGIRPMARKTGIAVSSIQYWKLTGFISPRRHQQIFDKARELGIEVAPDDFNVIEAAQ